MEKMNNSRDVFVFQTAWREILMTYPDSIRLEVYDAVMDYAATGEVPELKPLAKMAFSFIKADIDRRDAVQKELLDALYADAGCDDGRKRKKERRGRKSKRDRQDGEDGGMRFKPDFVPGQGQGLIYPAVGEAEGDILNFVARRWNAVCGDNMGLPKVSTLTASRRKKLHRRVKEWTKNFGENIADTVARLFAAIRQSDFLRGENRFGWRVTFDWIVKNATNALKVLEGNYKACDRLQVRTRCARDRADFGKESAGSGSASWSPIMSIM